MKVGYFSKTAETKVLPASPKPNQPKSQILFHKSSKPRDLYNITLAAGAAVCWKYLLLLCCYCVYYADIQQTQWLKQLLSGLSMGPTKIWV